MLSMTEQHRAGELACYSGLAINRNPFIGKQGVLNELKKMAWNRGFRYAERNSGTR